ncbi:TPA: exodeoxyribonuclease VII small subunit [Candidatus Marinimicrobia bacterium]|nr:MAG: Exodeoxyribonuclease 7 small subunit [Marinimicrobia bacterium 46_47]KUK90646.1 MAG: exodeoxyribonuclease VII small subunit [Marinimicrobia bacterium 46_43]HAE86920.1 exodeoxyribonuclease VII small subunit [Candidatus Neomarinimicrobiota bacterium]HBY17567.1 exodeoxyribonuclease VII small subunit [Candidatus Neomarinimicrobiota bacterium]
MTEKNESFEASLAKLEAILKRLETEDVPLEEMLTLYEEGVSLSQTCRKVLEDARKKLQVISEHLSEEKETTFE